MQSIFDDEYVQLRRTLRQLRGGLEAHTHGNPLEEEVELENVLGPLGVHEFFADDGDRGVRVDGIAWVALFEELGPSAVGPALLGRVGIAAALLQHTSGRTAEADRYRDATLAGELAAALAIEEAGVLWTSGTMSTTSRETGRHTELNGVKTNVLGVEGADVVLVVAAAGDGPGIFAVDPAAPGLTATPHERVDDRLAAHTLRFDRTPAVSLTGADGEAAGTRLLRGLDLARIALAAWCLGCAERALDLAVSYSDSRRQFGVPIREFQAVSHRCSDMHAMVDRMRALTFRAALDIASDDAAELAHSACLAKLVATDGYARVAGDAIRVQGGIGITWENPVASLYRRAFWARGLLGGVASERRRAAELALLQVRTKPS